MRDMKPAHMLFLVSCVVLACGGGCFQSKSPSLCTPPPVPPPPAATVPAEQPAQARAPATDTSTETAVVQASDEKR